MPIQEDFGTLWLDTETGGLNSKINSLLSLSITAPDGAEFKARIRAARGTVSTAEARRINGLDPEVGEDEAAVMQQLAKFLQEHPFSRIGGANAEKFDLPFLREAARRSGASLDLNRPIEDPISSAQQFGWRPRPRLSELASDLGISYGGQAHTAEVDVVVARDVYKALQDPRLREDAQKRLSERMAHRYGKAPYHENAWYDVMTAYPDIDSVAARRILGEWFYLTPDQMEKQMRVWATVSGYAKDTTKQAAIGRAAVATSMTKEPYDVEGGPGLPTPGELRTSEIDKWLLRDVQRWSKFAQSPEELTEMLFHAGLSRGQIDYFVGQRFGSLSAGLKLGKQAGQLSAVGVETIKRTISGMTNPIQVRDVLKRLGLTPPEFEDLYGEWEAEQSPGGGAPPGGGGTRSAGRQPGDRWGWLTAAGYQYRIVGDNVVEVDITGKGGGTFSKRIEAVAVDGSFTGTYSVDGRLVQWQQALPGRSYSPEQVLVSLLGKAKAAIRDLNWDPLRQEAWQDRGQAAFSSGLDVYPQLPVGYSGKLPSGLLARMFATSQIRSHEPRDPGEFPMYQFGMPGPYLSRGGERRPRDVKQWGRWPAFPAAASWASTEAFGGGTLEEPWFLTGTPLAKAPKKFQIGMYEMVSLKGRGVARSPFKPPPVPRPGGGSIQLPGAPFQAINAAVLLSGLMPEGMGYINLPRTLDIQHVRTKLPSSVIPGEEARPGVIGARAGRYQKLTLGTTEMGAPITTPVGDWETAELVSQLQATVEGAKVLESTIAREVATGSNVAYKAFGQKMYAMTGALGKALPTLQGVEALMPAYGNKVGFAHSVLAGAEQLDPRAFAKLKREFNLPDTWAASLGTSEYGGAEAIMAAANAYIEARTSFRPLEVVMHESLFPGQHLRRTATGIAPTKEFVGQLQGAEAMGEGRWKLRMTKPMYVGPVAWQARREYFGSQPFVSFEELEQISKYVSPGFAKRLMGEGGQLMAAYSELAGIWQSQTFQPLAKRSKMGAKATPHDPKIWEGVFGTFMDLMKENADPNQAWLLAMEEELGDNPLEIATGKWYMPKYYLPSARTISQFGAQTELGEQVSPLTTSYVELTQRLAETGTGGRQFLRSLRRFHKAYRGMFESPEFQRKLMGAFPRHAMEGPMAADLALAPREAVFGREAMAQLAGIPLGKGFESARSQRKLSAFIKYAEKRAAGGDPLIAMIMRRPVSDPRGQMEAVAVQVLSEAMGIERGMAARDLGRGGVFSPFIAAAGRGDVDVDRYITLLLQEGMNYRERLIGGLGPGEKRPRLQTQWKVKTPSWAREMVAKELPGMLAGRIEELAGPEQLKPGEQPMGAFRSDVWWSELGKWSEESAASKKGMTRYEDIMGGGFGKVQNLERFTGAQLQEAYINEMLNKAVGMTMPYQIGRALDLSGADPGARNAFTAIMYQYGLDRMFTYGGEQIPEGLRHIIEIMSSYTPATTEGAGRGASYARKLHPYQLRTRGGEKELATTWENLRVQGGPAGLAGSIAYAVYEMIQPGKPGKGLLPETAAKLLYGSNATREQVEALKSGQTRRMIEAGGGAWGILQAPGIGKAVGGARIGAAWQKGWRPQAGGPWAEGPVEQFAAEGARIHGGTKFLSRASGAEDFVQEMWNLPLQDPWIMREVMGRMETRDYDPEEFARQMGLLSFQGGGVTYDDLLALVHKGEAIFSPGDRLEALDILQAAQRSGALPEHAAGINKLLSKYGTAPTGPTKLGAPAAPPWRGAKRQATTTASGWERMGGGLVLSAPAQTQEAAINPPMEVTGLEGQGSAQVDLRSLVGDITTSVTKVMAAERASYRVSRNEAASPVNLDEMKVQAKRLTDGFGKTADEVNEVKTFLTDLGKAGNEAKRALKEFTPQLRTIEKEAAGYKPHVAEQLATPETSKKVAGLIGDIQKQISRGQPLSGVQAANLKWLQGVAAEARAPGAETTALQAELEQLTQGAERLDVAAGAGGGRRGRFGRGAVAAGGGGMAAGFEALLGEFSFGGAYFRAMGIERLLGRPVSTWTQAASQLQAARFGMGIELGAPATTLMASPLGQIMSFQAQMANLQAGLGMGQLQGQAGLAQMLGIQPTFGTGQTVGAFLGPAMTAAKWGLQAGVGAWSMGLLASKAGAMGGLLAGVGGAALPIGLGVAGLVGGGLALGELYSAGQPEAVTTQLLQERQGLRQGLGGGTQAGMIFNQLLYSATGGKAGASYGGIELPGTTTIADTFKVVSEQLEKGAREQFTRNLAQNPQVFEIQDAAIHIEAVEIPGLKEEEKYQGYGFAGLLGYEFPAITAGKADELVKQLAPVIKAGQMPAMAQTMQTIGQALGVTPGAGLQQFLGITPLSQAGQIQTITAAQVLGGVNNQLGITVTPQKVQAAAQQLAGGMTIQQLSLQAQQQAGALPIIQAMGYQPGSPGARMIAEGLPTPTSQAQAQFQGQIASQYGTLADILGKRFVEAAKYYTDVSAEVTGREGERRGPWGGPLYIEPTYSPEQISRREQLRAGVGAEAFGFLPGSERARQLQAAAPWLSYTANAQWQQAAQIAGPLWQQIGGNPMVPQQQFYNMLAGGMTPTAASMVAQTMTGGGLFAQAVGVMPNMSTVAAGRERALLQQGYTPQQIQQLAGMMQYGMTPMGQSMMQGGWGMGMELRQAMGMTGIPGLQQPVSYPFYEPGTTQWGTQGIYPAGLQQQMAWQRQQSAIQYQRQMGIGEYGAITIPTWTAQIQTPISSLSQQQQEQYKAQIQAAREKQQLTIAVPTQVGGGTFATGITGDIQQLMLSMESFKEQKGLRESLYNMQYQGQQRDIAYQMAMATLQYQQGLERLGMQRQMWGVNVGFQRQEMGFQWQQMQQQQQWGREDFAFNRQFAGLQYEWQMEDLDRAIRFATGREKEQLLRQRGRTEETYTIQEGRRTIQEERQETLWQQEDERFSRQRQHFETITALEAQQFDMQKRHMTEVYNLTMQHLREIADQAGASFELQKQLRALQDKEQERSMKYRLAELLAAQKAAEALHGIEIEIADQRRRAADGEAELLAKVNTALIEGGQALAEMQKALGVPVLEMGDDAGPKEGKVKTPKTGKPVYYEGKGKDKEETPADAAAAMEKMFSTQKKINGLTKENQDGTLKYLQTTTDTTSKLFKELIFPELANTRTEMSGLADDTETWLAETRKSLGEQGSFNRAWKDFFQRVEDRLAELGLLVTEPGGEPGGQHGGPLQGGHSYVVGEMGPELFMPNTSGFLVPNHQLSTGVSIGQVSISVEGAGDPQAVAMAVKQQFETMVNDLARRQRVRGEVW